MTMNECVEHAQTVAELACESARGFFRGKLGVEFKADSSPVTQADKGIEAEVRAYLSEHFPDHGIFGEEHGANGVDKDNLWIVDPIDGTRSFLSGNPLFGFLLAHLQHGTPQIGVVGMPVLGEIFVGVKDKGAKMNGEAIQASDVQDLNRAILYVNEGDKIYRDHPNVFARLMQSGQTRRMSYDCYPHALLAAGHVDAVVDYDLQPYDYLPVSALVEAAGGLMTDWQGNALSLGSDGRVISAATPQLHAELLDLVNG
ncbi:inositol monophosphatase family protein [Falsiruegeria mediterranea]|jgi:histidinol phosphatase-like enzyme (inositol monophosphatase family)|uniref:Inositol-1-monophosphatase n=1 Tax=Falsiruegeria mediterranea M17 TaxID=1200281 RepID=A0A2R8CDJ8_9RHOB|nr:inositol monophosphatase family protein [Falsiruegeria mediterranea]SPJ30533.1 Inositol-1-monophosphatase [Falsiruegeria mediterranea M17]